MGGNGSGKMPVDAIIKLDGTIKLADGTTDKTKLFEYLDIDLDDYSDIEMTAGEAQKFMNHVRRMKTGLSAFLPKLCPGPAHCPLGATSTDTVEHARCPFKNRYPVGRACHPPGTMIKVIDGSSVPIEQLDPEKHKILSMARKYQFVRSNNKAGYDFSVSGRCFSGNLINIKAGEYNHYVTPDHISLVRFNKKAIDKFCVYLMRRGDYWRVGKTTVVTTYKCSGRDHKTRIGFQNRARREDADAMWILGVYNTNTEALLAEEYYSINWQIPKACFPNSIDKTKRKKTKYNGLYKWVTKEQLIEHYNSVKKPVEYYKEKLESINRDINYPIWERNNFNQSIEKDVKLFCIYPMFIRSCNIMSDVMDVVIYPEKQENKRFCDIKGKWLPVEISYKKYNGLVYSLGVKNEHKLYFANDIATHNCLLEVQMIKIRTKEYVESLDIDVASPYQMSLVDRLVELDIFEYRANIGLSATPEGASLLKTEETETKSGDTLESVIVHPYLQAKESFHRKRMNILEALVATPREEYKKAAAIKKRDTGGISSQLSEAKRMIEKMKTSSSFRDLDDIIEDANKVAESDIYEADWEQVTVPNDE